MHEREISIDVGRVRVLVAAQFPEFAGLAITPVRSSGTDNSMFRLGDGLAVRLPRAEWAVEMVAKEQRWVPVLAERVSLRVPRVVAVGAPSEEFAFAWSIVEWLPGEPAYPTTLADGVEAARALGGFVRQLQQIDPRDGPVHDRGGPVRRSDEAVRIGLAGVRDEVDRGAVKRAWERVLDVPDYDGRPRWFHGDLGPLNVLAHDGRLSAVIDWGTCGVGDPAVDARAAWYLFDRHARSVYREVAGFDDDAWERGKGWVLNGVYGIPYYRDTNPVLVRTIVEGIRAVLDDG